MSSHRKILLSKYKFLSRLIDHYSTTKMHTSGFRGFILKITNYIRFQSDTQPPGEYLKNFLNSHEAWKDFIPVLRDETYGQLVTDYPPPPHSGPLNPFVQHDFSSFASKPLKPLTRDDISIDLGSKYANNLGFDGKAPYVSQEQKKRKRKRKKGGKKSGDAAEGDSSDSSSTMPLQNGNSTGSEKKSGCR